MTKLEENKTNKRKKLFKILALTTGSLTFVYLLYYYFIGSHHVTTDNAYVGAEIAQINAATGGVIEKVNVTDTQEVKAGDILVTINNADSKLALAIAKANLTKAESSFSQAQATYKRRKTLKELDSASEEEVTNAKNDFKAAEAGLESAKVSLEQAKLDLERTVIRSPIDGVVARRQVQLGQRVQIGTNLMAVTPKNEMHIDANFKEVQLKKVRINQPVKITSDKYGSSVIYHGRVAGFSGGTGAAFAVIPAQNATGNWIKVVQRVPVRIELLPEELNQHPLQVGLSMHVDINVSETK